MGGITGQDVDVSVYFHSSPIQFYPAAWFFGIPLDVSAGGSCRLGLLQFNGKDVNKFTVTPDRAIYGLPNQPKLLNIQWGIKIFYPKKF
jgi:hypothetical protein